MKNILLISNIYFRFHFHSHLIAIKLIEIEIEKLNSYNIEIYEEGFHNYDSKIKNWKLKNYRENKIK